jgi:ABC-type multidrug transport system fused ATPase/permease subunit
MSSLIWSLLKPYRGSLVIILVAMLVQTVMSVAAPWPLKIILDNVVGEHKLTPWLDDFLRPFMSSGTEMQIAAAAASATVLIALLCRRRFLPCELLHHQRGPVGGQRPPATHLSSSAATLAELLQHPRDGHVVEHHHG